MELGEVGGEGRVLEPPAVELGVGRSAGGRSGTGRGNPSHHRRRSIHMSPASASCATAVDLPASRVRPSGSRQVLRVVLVVVGPLFIAGNAAQGGERPTLVRRRRRARGLARPELRAPRPAGVVSGYILQGWSQWFAPIGDLLDSRCPVR